MEVSIYNIKGKLVYFLEGRKVSLRELFTLRIVNLTILELKINSLLKIGINEGDVYEFKLEPFSDLKLVHKGESK
jgi:hypothetical protein